MRQVQKERTTLTAVATLAGVSTSTASLVLSGKGAKQRIPEETRDRVRTAAEQLNYAPNLLTRSLRRGRTHILSFFSGFRHRERDDAYMDRVYSAVELAGGQYGYDILVHCNFKRTPREVYQFLNGGLADGVILFAPPHDDPLLPRLRKSALPVVVMNGTDPRRNYSSVRDDVEEGMQLVCHALRSHGHRKVALLSGEGADVRDASLRVGRLAELLKWEGIATGDSPVTAAPNSVARVIDDLFSQPDPPTAIFCWHDHLAYHVVEELERREIGVPKQVSVIGYDGLRWPSATGHIVTSVQVDLFEHACQAIRLLDQVIRQESASPQEVVVPVSLSIGTTLTSAHVMQRSNS